MITIKVNISDAELNMLREAAAFYEISLREAYDRAISEKLEYYNKIKLERENGSSSNEQKKLAKHMKTAYKQLKKKESQKLRENPEDMKPGKIIELYPSETGFETDGDNRT